MIPLAVLKRVDPETLAKAATCLMEGGYFVSVSAVHERYILGQVHGGAATYEVTLAEHRPHCTCPDAQFRKRVCKHVALFSLALIRGMQLESEGAVTAHVVPQPITVKRLPPRHYEDWAH